ncbi:hypothetical protein L198_05887 [Cryptococcus wingfieldii CBS 7118]|uniref:Uncharacterized protein n=1 Tax=Cryptococcus wingfieldii CBS 7118 TaxID=1295528 RepID=A0A1E3ISE3_9TREE|nr:hypothetical protein L198_05887 [Cryptococcus wingfieldii CBS 7118]ODN91375.1 hypothetical protein L198_05887 [Cryptococcus wingfieldii CBS 7118]
MPTPTACSLPDLPREVLSVIALAIYDPLELSQQDRLTWGIFSTVDMHEERQESLRSLIHLGLTCRKIRREVKPLLFTCVRVGTVECAKEMIENYATWGVYVRSIIIDCSMFEAQQSHEDFYPDLEEAPVNPRTCWEESALLVSLLTALPNLEHISFFADASDDTTLSLMFAALIPSARPSASGANSFSWQSLEDTDSTGHVPFAQRIKSFGWRQRASPPQFFHQFSQTSTFICIYHFIRHAVNLSFLVLDTNTYVTASSDILAVLRELAAREVPAGGRKRLSLMLCGPIDGWEADFLHNLGDTYDDIGELFIDRPMEGSMIPVSGEEDVGLLLDLIQPLTSLHHLHLLQVGSYAFDTPARLRFATVLSVNLPSLRVMGLLGSDGETLWMVAWREKGLERAMKAAAAAAGGGGGGLEQGMPLRDSWVMALQDGDLAEVDQWPDT